MAQDSNIKDSLPMTASDRRNIGQAGILTLDTVGGLERWCQQRMSVYSHTKEAFVLVTVLLMGFFGGPALVFYFAKWIFAGSLGTSGGGAAALMFNGCLYLLLAVLAAFLGYVVLQKLFRPTHLFVDQNGIGYGYGTPFGFFKRRTMTCEQIERIEIVKPGATVNPEKYKVRFCSRSKRKFDLPLKWLGSVEVKESLADVVNSHMAKAERDLDVAFFLQSPPVNSFTELWFQSMNPPDLLTKKTSLPE